MDRATYDSLFQQAYNKGCLTRLSQILYIDKKYTLNIYNYVGQCKLTRVPQTNLENLNIFRKYFHLMLVLQLEYELLIDTKMDVKLSNTLTYYHLICGYYSFQNNNLYNDIEKYCSIYKYRLWDFVKDVTL